MNYNYVINSNYHILFMIIIMNKNNFFLDDTEKNNSLINCDEFDEGYESDDEINIEVTDYKNGNTYTHIYTVPYKPTHCNKKRLICYSIINNDQCEYYNNCTYAHSLEEQKIDEEKIFVYKIILDKELMNFFSITNPKTDEIYKQLFFATHLCEYCINHKCTGGYNCRHGVCNFFLKLCRNDLLTGQCLNKIIDIPINLTIYNKIYETNVSDTENENKFNYTGCINGHHLTERNLIPYYKYVHQKENYKKNRYQSVRYIDIRPLKNILTKNDYGTSHTYDPLYSDDESTDEEINSWFQKKYNSDSDSDYGSEYDEFNIDTSTES